MTYIRYALIALFVNPSFGWAGQHPVAVVHKDVVYLSVDRLAEFLQGTSRLSPLGRDVVIEAKDRKWEFLDGGSRLKLPSGKERALEHPPLILYGKFFLPLMECADAFGCRVISHPVVMLVHAGKDYSLEPRPIGSTYHRHRAEKLEAVHEFVVVETPLRGLRSLHRKDDVRGIPAGTILLVRRRVVFDGQPYVIANDCGPSLESYLILAKDLRSHVKPGQGATTVWSNSFKRLVEQGKQEAGLRHGDRKQFDKTVAVTVDLCWSLRAYEAKLLQSLKQFADRTGKTIHPVFFVSGRWLEQHPMEMHNLIEWSLASRVNVIWGNHSWQHPKAGGFMNEFPPPDLREDTLRLERLYLEWGIVPTVYYRFPGLIHDRTRLRTILDLDLFPVDCDSWLALVRQKEKGPFYYHAKDGSIILLHGNGNEPAGIPALEKWLQDHVDWELGHLSRFVVQ